MQHITAVFIGLNCLLLSSCGGGGPQPLRSDASNANDTPQTAPLIEILFNDFDPETTTLRFSEGEIIEFKINSITAGVQTASLIQTSGPPIDFGTIRVGGQESDGDVDAASSATPIDFTLNDLEGPREARIDRFDRLTVEFRAPSVSRRTEINFRFQSRNATTSRDRNIPIIIEDDAAVLTLNGQASKGLLSNTEIRLFSVDRLNIGFGGNREIIEPVLIDATGQYSFTVLPATDLEDLLRFEVEGDGADMICDAPLGCNEFAFGETFVVERDLDLRALIEVPSFGTTRSTHINILTTLAAKRAGQINGLNRISPRDLRDASEDVASIFGLPEQDFSTVPFIDITQPFTSSDENAVRIAMIGGSVLGATFLHSDPDDDDDYLEELDDFIDEFGDREVFCRDAPDQSTLSIEDVMAQALEIAIINNDVLLQNFFQSRLNGIRNGTFTCDFVTPPPPE